MMDSQDWDLIPAEIQSVAEDVRNVGQQLAQHSHAIANDLLSLFKTVHQHDTWTCPVTVQHALQELTRSFELASHPLEKLLLDITHSFDSDNLEQARQRFASLASTTRDQLMLPSHKDLDVYSGQVQAYLSENSGSMATKMRRRWRPSGSTELRVNFAHSRFAVPWSWSHDPAARTDPNCVRHLRKYCQDMEGTLDELKPLMLRWATILPNVFSSTGQSELHPDQAYQLSLYLYEHRKWLGSTVRPCFRRCFFGLVHDIGWTMGTRNLVQDPDIRTVEDRFGAFEHWACVSEEGTSHLPRWFQDIL